MQQINQFVQIHLRILFVRGKHCKVSYGHWSQVADGHLGWAQVADTWCVGHIDLGSNFQPSLIWLMHILNYLYLKVQV